MQLPEAHPSFNGLQTLDDQLALVRTYPNYAIRPTVVGVVYAPSEEQLALCLPIDRADRPDEAWKFPQEGIKNHETATATAFLRGMEEELGIPPDDFVDMYGLPGEPLLGTPHISKKGIERSKMLFPVVGILHDTVELVPQATELADARWESTLSVVKTFDAQDQTRRSVHNRQAILTRFCLAAETANWSHIPDSLLL